MKAQPGSGPGRDGALPSADGPHEKPDRGLSRSQRLTRNAQFQRIFAQGRSYVGRCMVLWVGTAPDARRRLGVIASRKVGGAVDRSKARRRLREAWRLNRHRLSGRVDVILVARGAILRATADQVEHELMALCGRAGLIDT